MTSLLDIAPAAERVQIGDSHIECCGISVARLVSLLRRFPALRSAIFDRGQSDGLNTASAAQTLLEAAPDAIAAIIAAGTGNETRMEEEAAAARLPIELQFDLLVAILKATMPGGVGPFVAKLAQWFGGVSESVAKSLPRIEFAVEDAPPLPNGKDETIQSPQPSSG